MNLKLTLIGKIIEYKNLNKEVILCGDFNADFAKCNIYGKPQM